MGNITKGKPIKVVRSIRLDLPPIYAKGKATLLTDGKTQFIGLFFNVSQNQENGHLKVIQIINTWDNMKPKIFKYFGHKKSEFDDPDSFDDLKIIRYKVRFKSRGNIKPISEIEFQWDKDLICKFTKTCLDACLAFWERKISFVLTVKNLFLI